MAMRIDDMSISEIANMMEVDIKSFKAKDQSSKVRHQFDIVPDSVAYC